MPLDLASLQAEFRSHVLGGSAPRLATLAAGPEPIEPAARLRVYRNHVFVSLGAALAATFAGVAALVGPDFFRAMARAYVAGHPPRTPCLVEYGDGFAAFVAAYEPAQGLPYLGDVARLEWAMNAVLHAPEAPPVTAGRLAALPSTVRLRLHPAVRLVASPWPVDRIWRAAMAGDADGSTVDAGSGPVALLVLRDGEDAALATLAPGAAAFHAALEDHATLEQAAEAAVGAAPGVDLTATLQQALALGLMVEGER